MKERIIGAIVLVIFVVLVVPIFLDGPPDDGEIISERVLLPGQEDKDIKTVVLNRGRSEPIPLVNSARSTSSTPDKETEVSKPKSQEATRPQSERAQEDIAPQAQAAPEEPEASATGMWAVQLGSFSSRENADKLAADLRKQGYAAFLSQLQTDAGQLHRVRIGPQEDRDSAEAMAASLKKVNHSGQVVPHP